MGLPFFLLFLR